MNIIAQFTRYVVTGLAIILLSACQSGGWYGNVDDVSGTRAYGVSESGVFYGQDNQLSMQELRKLRNTTIVYFGFDKDTVNRKDMAVVAAHGVYLAKHPKAKIVLEGHTDKRGSREYNIGLGERRDKTVKRMMMLNGAKSNQIKMVSYGQEKPAAFGDDENAHAQNRRVEIIYKRY